MMRKAQYVSLAIFLLSFTACSSFVEKSNQIQISESEAGLEDLCVEESDMEEFGIEELDKEGLDKEEIKDSNGTEGTEMPSIQQGEKAAEKSKYTDQNGDIAIIPAEFRVSDREDEQTICSGLVVIGPDESEFVWIPTTQTSLAVRDFGSYFSGGSISGYYDETELASYQEMVESTELYGGFYMGRFEASYGSGDNVSNYIPASKRVAGDNPGRIWVQFSPQDTTIACQNLYADNETVQGFFLGESIMTLRCNGWSIPVARQRMRWQRTVQAGVITAMTPFHKMPTAKPPVSGRKPSPTTYMIWRAITGNGHRKDTGPAVM